MERKEKMQPETISRVVILAAQLYLVGEPQVSWASSVGVQAWKPFLRVHLAGRTPVVSLMGAWTPV